MGIYVFKKDLMLKLLREKAKYNDFGGEIIPEAAASSRVMAYLFNDYWEDIGTIKSFFEANLGLAQQVLPPLHMHDAWNPSLSGRLQTLEQTGPLCSSTLLSNGPDIHLHLRPYLW